MKRKRRFPLGIVLSLTTGKLLVEGGFADMSELAEFVVGHSIYTHEMAERALWDRMKEKLIVQHPQLQAVNAETITQDNFREILAEHEAHFGKTLLIESGSDERHESPLESLERIAPGRPVVVLLKDTGEQN